MYTNRFLPLKQVIHLIRQPKHLAPGMGKIT
jgi:hypothetical protein